MSEEGIQNTFNRFQPLEKDVINKYLSPEQRTDLKNKLNQDQNVSDFLTILPKLVSYMIPSVIRNGRINLPEYTNEDSTRFQNAARRGAMLGSRYDPGSMIASRIKNLTMSPLVFMSSILKANASTGVSTLKRSILGLENERIRTFSLTTSFVNGYHIPALLEKLIRKGLRYYHNEFITTIVINYIYELLNLLPNDYFRDNENPRERLFRAFLSIEKYRLTTTNMTKRNSGDFYNRAEIQLIGMYQNLQFFKEDLKLIEEKNVVKSPFHAGGKKRKTIKKKSTKKTTKKKSTKKTIKK